MFLICSVNNLLVPADLSIVNFELGSFYELLCVPMVNG